MLVTYPNDVKIYNLSAGKSLPEWLSERKRRTALKKNIDLRRRIELIQDFDMPDASHTLAMSPDGNHIFAAGTYKPRLRCYDTRDLSMKFERCLDSDVIKIQTLSDGFEKFVLLEEERWLEFHVQYGHYFKLRIPKFGRDIAYVEPRAELFAVGSGSDVYRLNLELGQFVPSLITSGPSLLSCDVCPEHYLFVCGTSQGRLEAWDPRSKKQVASLDCLASIGTDVSSSAKLGLSCLKFKNGLQLAVGTESGHVLMYDIRSSRPYVVKDHLYGRPIKSVAFNNDPQVVLSMDTKILKIWHENNAKPYTSIEPNVRLNDLCTVPGTGLLFMANDGQKVLTYYVPSLGPAPRWCSFLDSITEELEETVRAEGTVFDDYKFVTMKDLDELGLSNLVGTSLLRAYMHGYFMDARLYKKTRDMMNPFAYDEYRKKKIRDTLEKERQDRAKVDKLPPVNKELAKRLMMEQKEAEEMENKKRSRRKPETDPGRLLTDARFKALFERSDFQIDPESDEFQMINPALVRVQKMKREKMLRKEREAAERQEAGDQDDGLEDEAANKDTAGSSVDEEDSSANSSEDEEIVQTVKEAYRDMKRAKRGRQDESDNSDVEEESEEHGGQRFGLIELTSGRTDPLDWRNPDRLKQQQQVEGLSLEERLRSLPKSSIEQCKIQSRGREMVVQLKKDEMDKREKKAAAHLLERKQARRSVAPLRGRKKATMRKLL